MSVSFDFDLMSREKIITKLLIITKTKNFQGYSSNNKTEYSEYCCATVIITTLKYKSSEALDVHDLPKSG